jgi:hypothetical protein
MAETLQWEYDGEIPIIMSINTLKYIKTYTYIKIYHKYTISTFKIHSHILLIHSNIFKCKMSTFEDI